MAREGRDYAEVLAEAQAAGYAEADPTGDVEGLDALNKLVILARLAFGAWLDPASVANRPGTTTRRDGLPGITGVTADGRRGAARPRAGSLRLIATARLAEDGAIEASVVPTRGPGRVAVRALRRRAQPGRGRRRAGRPGRVRGPGRRRRADGRRRCSADLVAIARGLGSTWAGAAPATERVRRSRSGRSPASASRRRRAPATRSGTEAPVIDRRRARPRLVERYRAFLPVTRRDAAS